MYVAKSPRNWDTLCGCFDEMLNDFSSIIGTFRKVKIRITRATLLWLQLPLIGSWFSATQSFLPIVSMRGGAMR